MDEKRKWTFKITPGNIGLILLGTAFNIMGRQISDALTLPVWLDSIGTFICAVLLGPLAGAISGALMNVVHTLVKHDQIWYVLVSISGGIAVGLFFPRDKKIDSFWVVATALFAGLVMTLVATPISLVFNGGYSGNAWGDALFDMLYEKVAFKPFCALAGGLLVNMPDKVVCIFITMAVLALIRKRKDRGNDEGGADGTGVPQVLLLALALSIAFATDAQAQVRDLRADHTNVIFGEDDGLLSAEINTIVQTRDGYIWAGSYSGLYLYDGRKFVRVQVDRRISNVTELFEDSRGKLWIGTNDSGVARYDTQSREIRFFTTNEGLASDSIRSICEDDEGGIYVGTMSSLCRIKDDEVTSFDSLSPLKSVYSL